METIEIDASCFAVEAFFKGNHNPRLIKDTQIICVGDNVYFRTTDAQVRASVEASFNTSVVDVDLNELNLIRPFKGFGNADLF